MRSSPTRRFSTERKIRQAKQEFGVKSYDLYANDMDASAILSEYKEKIEKLSSTVAAKKEEIEALKTASSPRAGDASFEQDDDGGVVI